LRIYGQAKRLKTRLAAVPEDVVRTFLYYESLVKKVTAAALVLSTVAAGAAECTSSHKYSGGVDFDAGVEGSTADSQTSEDTGTGTVESTDTQGDTVSSDHRYSGGVALDTESQG